jgi:hypothetical protein
MIGIQEGYEVTFGAVEGVIEFDVFRSVPNRYDAHSPNG